MTLELKQGDPWPFQSSRGLTGAPCEPRWYGLITAPLKEKETGKKLENAGCDVKFPTWKRTRHIAGKKHIQEVPVIPRIIYAEFNYEPQWDVMKARKVIHGVFSIGDRPVPLRYDDVAVVMNLPTEAERMEEELREALRPKVGQRAQIAVGPFSGFFVDVTRVEFGRVWWEMACGIKGDGPEQAIRSVG